MEFRYLHTLKVLKQFSLENNIIDPKQILPFLEETANLTHVAVAILSFIQHVFQEHLDILGILLHTAEREE